MKYEYLVLIRTRGAPGYGAYRFDGNELNILNQPAQMWKDSISYPSDAWGMLAQTDGYRPLVKCAAKRHLRNLNPALVKE